MNLFTKHKTLFKILLCLFFLYLFFLRTYHLCADSSFLHILIEERASGYNARNKVLFGDWDSGGGQYQPFAYMPLANLILYGVFKFFSIGILQLRLPFVILTCIALVLFYLLLKRRYGTPYGLLGLALLGLSYPMVEWNRSSLNENLFIFFIILILYLYQRLIDEGKPHYYFWLGFLLTIFILIKLSGLLFILFGFVFLIRRIFKEEERLRKNALLNFSSGIFFGIIICAGVFFFTDAYKYIAGMYGQFAKTHIAQLSTSGTFRVFNFIMRILENAGFGTAFLNKAIYILNLSVQAFLYLPMYIFGVEPVSFFIVLMSLPLFLVRNTRRFELEHLNMAWLLFGIIPSIIRSPFLAMYFKTILFLFPPLFFLAVCFLYHLKHTDMVKERLKSKVYLVWVGLVLSYCLFLSLMLKQTYMPFSILPAPPHYYYNYHFLKYSILPLSLSMKIFSSLIIVIVFCLPFLVFLYLSRRISRPSKRIALVKGIIVSSFVVFLAYSNLYIIRNLILPRGGFRYTTVNFARELNKLIPKGSSVAVSKEDIFRFAAYGTENKYIFFHDAIVPKPDELELLKGPNISYFALAYRYGLSLTSFVDQRHIEDRLKQQIWQRLIKIYPEAKVIARYHLVFNDKTVLYHELGVEIVDLQGKSLYPLKEKVIINK